MDIFIGGVYFVKSYCFVFSLGVFNVCICTLCVSCGGKKVWFCGVLKMGFLSIFCVPVLKGCSSV